METVELSCPGCAAKLRTNPAVLGTRVRCPKCQHEFTAASGEAPSAAVQVRATPPPLTIESRPGTATWQRGQRVFARWNDGFCYPATVQTCDIQSVRVTFDDGAVSLVEREEVYPIQLKAGDRAFVRWQGGPAYFPGRLTRVADEQLDIDYDDGERETSTLSMVRVVRGAQPWRVGDRVLAQWPAETFFYPAKITAIDDDVFLTVAYEDGDQAQLLPPQVRALDLRDGDRVYARWQRGPNYFPGRITDMDGERIHVHYDDGETEWSTIGLVRVLPEELRRDVG